MIKTNLANLKVIFVDDEPDTEFLFKSFFRKELKDGGLDFTFKENGRHAMDHILDVGGVDLVVTDINMPIMSGVELIEELERKRIDCDVVIMTAYDNIEQRKFASLHHVKHYFSKPLNLENFKEWLNHYRSNLKTTS